MWRCVCDCGTVRDVQGYNLSSGKTNSCGCFSADVASRNNKKHGMRKSTEYRIWSLMIQRCHNKNNPGYRNWGSRGIKVCDAWLESFENFYKDMGRRPDGTSLDRIDNDGNYEPSNCRWATKRQQTLNRRVRRDSKTGVNGVSDCGNRYCAKYTKPCGKKVEKNFSKNKYGDREAFMLAVSARKYMEDNYDVK